MELKTRTGVSIWKIKIDQDSSITIQVALDAYVNSFVLCALALCSSLEC